MSDRYDEFRILYSLYAKHYEGLLNGIDINRLLNEEDLRFIDRDIILGEINYLQDQELIKLDRNPHFESLKITAKGIDLVDRILQKYFDYLKGNNETGLEGSYNNISGMPNLFQKRKTTYFFIKKRTDIFNNFLLSSSIFEKLLSPTITQVYNLVDRSIHTEYLRNLGLMPIEARIRRLEDNYLERKPCFKYDVSIKGPSRDREKQISKSIAGLLNTNGGILFIGVDDAGNVLGLRNDYSVVKKNNADGFEIELRNSIGSFLKKKVANELIVVKFPSVEGEEICEISIKPSSEPLVLDDNGIQQFFVREGNSTKPYSLLQAIEYCINVFKKLMIFR